MLTKLSTLDRNSSNLISLSKLKKTKKIKFYYVIITISVCLLLISYLFSIYVINTQNTQAKTENFGIGANYEYIFTLNEKVSKNVPLSTTQIYASNIPGDKRVVALYIFLSRYSSPMAQTQIVKAFIDNAEKHGFADHWFILPAISGIESAFGKLIPLTSKGEPSYNAWGWSGGSKYNRWSYFSSWVDAIEKISEQLPKIYGHTNYEPKRMVKLYCPPCSESPNSLWVKAVNKYIDEINAIYKSIK